MTWLEKVASSGESSSFLESLFEHLTDAVMTIDRNGFIVEANPAALRLTGYSAAEIRDIHLCSICMGIASEEEEAVCGECFIHQQSVSAFEMRVRARDGREFPVTASFTRLPSGAHGSMAVVLRDLTAQHRMERERNHRMITNYVIQAQEEERKRVSRDLHDGVGQALYSIIVGLKTVNQIALEDSEREHLEEVHRMAEQTLQNVKNLAVELRPSTLDDLGLVPAIRSFAKRYEKNYGIDTVLEVKGRRARPAPEVETALYRICQEAMINAAKYADTDQVKMVLSNDGRLLELEVRDFGQGFNLKQIRVQGTGLGLYGMRERAKLVGGSFEIDSAAGSGTRVRVMVPIKEKRGETRDEHPGPDR